MNESEGEPILTRTEALTIAMTGYQEVRDQVRDMAHAASGDENERVRDALLRAVFLLDAWRDSIPARFGVDPATVNTVAVVRGSARLPQRPPNRGHHTIDVARRVAGG